MGDEELQRAVRDYELLRAQLEAMAQQNEILRLSLEEHMRARETMARFQKGGEGAEILVPVGANSFLFANIRNPDRAIVGIGSDMSVEEDMDNAIKRLEGRIEDINKAIKGLVDRMVAVSQKADEKSELVKELYQKTQPKSG